MPSRSHLLLGFFIVLLLFASAAYLRRLTSFTFDAESLQSVSVSVSLSSIEITSDEEYVGRAWY